MRDHKIHQSQTHMHERGPHVAHIDHVHNNARTRGDASSVNVTSKHAPSKQQVSGVGIHKIARDESLGKAVAKDRNCARLEGNVGIEVKIEGDDHLVVHEDDVPADLERGTSTD